MGIHTYTYVYMGTKTLTITQEAYERLRAHKGPSESFTDVVLRLTERPSLLSFAGLLPSKSVDAIEAQITQREAIRTKRDREEYR